MELCDQSGPLLPVNPLTGELIGCPGVVVAEEPAAAAVVTPQRPRNRIPPGGYSTPLW